MINYDYPYVSGSGGSRWTMNQRIQETLGFRPRQTCKAQVNGEIRTVVSFDSELTAQQKADLDALMASNPASAPDSVGTVFVIKDLYEGFLQFCNDIGFTARIYFTDSVPGLEYSDQIEIHFDETLTNQQKNKVLSEYGKLIKEQL